MILRYLRQKYSGLYLRVEGPELDQGSRWGVMSQAWCIGGAGYTSVMPRVPCPAGCLLSLLPLCTVKLCSVHCPLWSPIPFHPGCSAASQSLECNTVVLHLPHVQNRCRGAKQVQGLAFTMVGNSEHSVKLFVPLNSGPPFHCAKCSHLTWCWLGC